MKKRFLLLLFIMILAQLLAPVFMIASYYNTISRGEEFTFSVQPVDPYDAFRGRFVQIRPNAGQGEFRLLSSGEVVRLNEDASYAGAAKTARAYAAITKDDEGFAKIGDVSLKKPGEGAVYIKSTFRYGRLNLPLERYYMNERLAPSAEKVVRDEGLSANIKVRIYRGRAFITGLYVEDKPIEQYLKK